MSIRKDSRSKKDIARAKAIKKAFEGIDRVALAKALGTESMSFIYQIIGSFVQVSPAKAKQIERATLKRVTAKLLRPDIFE